MSYQLVLYQKVYFPVRGSGKFVVVVAPRCLSVDLPPHRGRRVFPSTAIAQLCKPRLPQANQQNDRDYTDISPMSSSTPSSRPVRRVAASRRTKRVVESSGSDAESNVNEQADSDATGEGEGGSTPPHRPGPRRKSRRIASTPAPSAAAPSRIAGARRTRSRAETEAPPSAVKPRVSRRSGSKRAVKLETPEVEEKVSGSEQPAMEDSPMEEAFPIKENTPVGREESTPPVGTPLISSVGTPLPSSMGTPLPPSVGAPLSPSVGAPLAPSMGAPLSPSVRAPLSPSVGTPLRTLPQVPGPATPTEPLEEVLRSPAAENVATPRPTSSYSSSSQNPPVVVRSRANALLQQEQLTQERGPLPRLVITHLVLVNFKSYAGRQEVGPFHAVGLPCRSG